MSVTITLYNFSKRENSTKLPTDGGYNISCFFKENTSKYSPSFIVNIPNVNNYTYAKWDNIYYYITDIVFLTNETAELQCEVDVLATWKTQIGNVSAFTRFSTSGYDVGITDIRLSSNPEVIRKSSSVSPFSGREQRYIVGLLLNGFSDVVCLSWGDMRILTLAIMSSAYGDLFTDITKGVSKILTDTSKCITSCYYNPVCYVNNDTSFTPTLAGGYTVDGISLNPPLRNKKISVTVSIPWAFDLSDFRNRSSFTDIELYLPAYGVLSLNADNFFGRSSIKIDITVDSGGGDITYNIENIAKCTCNVLCPVQVSTTSTGNMAGLGIGMAAATSSAMKGNPLGVLAGGFSAILSTMETNVGNIGGVGGTSNFNANSNIVCTVITHDTNVSPSSLTSNYGRPCNKVKQISSGYNECTNASVNCNAPQNLKDRINSYMNGGFYYE